MNAMDAEPMSVVLLKTSEEVRDYVKKNGYKELFLDMMGIIPTLDKSNQWDYVEMLQLGKHLYTCCYK